MSSKSELTKTIEAQQLRIARLEQHVVTAYKNLQKEKEALESTVRVLSSPAASTVSSRESTVGENETKDEFV
ncbi:unnamed protein product [Rotaria sp. Silwood1]|nr:unnamed protein product [Rotaria sp. Silwood1]